jgi:ParB-like chromosome segregation protein Spo0J
VNSTERFEKVNIDKLVPYARNARTHSKEQILQLRASLREFGFVNPVIVDKDLNIIAGHGRILAAKEEGVKEVPCVFAEHLSEAQKRAYIIADNRLALNAGWDPEMLSVEISDLQGVDFDISLLGFDDAELNKLLGDNDDVQEDDFDVDAELKKPATTKPGDL